MPDLSKTCLVCISFDSRAHNVWLSPTHLKESVKHICPCGICPLDCFTAGGKCPPIVVFWQYEEHDLMNPKLLCWVYTGRNCVEQSQWSFLLKASWHSPLICPLTEEKERENWTQLRTETLFKELLNWKRVLALQTQIFGSVHATLSASSLRISFNLSPRVIQSLEKPSFFWREPVWLQCQVVTV